MNQFDYEIAVNKLNSEKFAEMEPLKAEMEKMHNERRIMRDEIAQINVRIAKKSDEIYDIQRRISIIKQNYATQKDKLRIEFLKTLNEENNEKRGIKDTASAE